jgi:hypothetical protein
MVNESVTEKGGRWLFDYVIRVFGLNKISRPWEEFADSEREVMRLEFDHLCKDLGLVLLAEDQGLPENPYLCTWDKRDRLYGDEKIFYEGQQSLVDAGFKKVIEPEMINNPCPKGGEHEWGTDGCHLNVFCKKCFQSKVKDV